MEASNCNGWNQGLGWNGWTADGCGWTATGSPVKSPLPWREAGVHKKKTPLTPASLLEAGLDWSRSDRIGFQECAGAAVRPLRAAY